MRSIQRSEPTELDFLDLDSLLAAVESGDVVPDSIVPFDEAQSDRGYRLRDYVGTPGTEAVCPHCGLGGGSIDSAGFFTCERCDYYNWEATPESDGHGLIRDRESDDDECDDDARNGELDFDVFDPDSYFDDHDIDDALPTDDVDEMALDVADAA